MICETIIVADDKIVLSRFWAEEDQGRSPAGNPGHFGSGFYFIIKIRALEALMHRWISKGQLVRIAAVEKMYLIASDTDAFQTVVTDVFQNPLNKLPYTVSLSVGFPFPLFPVKDDTGGNGKAAPSLSLKRIKRFGLDLLLAKRRERFLHTRQEPVF